MIISTLLCYKSEEQTQFDKLGIDKKTKYKESYFMFNLEDVTGIDEPGEEEGYFVIFLKGANGLLIHHDYDKLLKNWQDAKAH